MAPNTFSGDGDALAAMIQSGVVPLYNGPDPEQIWGLLGAAQAAGMGVFEWTDRDAKALEVFTAISARAAQAGSAVMLGAGSIITVERAQAYLAAGARFIVGPALVESLANFCREKGVLYVPGCATPSEMVRAHELGCRLIKLFPAGNLGGPDYLKALRAPLPQLKIMPTGGVDTDEKNLRAWFAAGAVCVGLGSQLFPKAEIAGGDFKKIAERMRQVKATVDQIRKETHV